MTNALFSSSVEQTADFGPVITLKYTPIADKEKPISVSIAPERGSNMFKYAYGWTWHYLHWTWVVKRLRVHGNFVLFPTPNRVKNSTYTWHGKTITQKKNGELRPLHGLIWWEMAVWGTDTCWRWNFSHYIYHHFKKLSFVWVISIFMHFETLLYTSIQWYLCNIYSDQRRGRWLAIWICASSLFFQIIRHW